MHDADDRLGLVVRAEFEQGWDGLYFVITDAREAAQRSFNRAAQWAAVRQAPVDGNLSRPIDMEVLRIATPALIFREL